MVWVRSGRLEAGALRVGGRDLVGLALLLAVLTIGGAWASEILGGLVPCELCLEQRRAYYFGVPVLLLLLGAWPRLSGTLRFGLLGLGGAIFAWSAYMGAFHAGVEWGFWPGPTACSGVGGDLDFSDLAAKNLKPVIACDAVQFRLFGLSFAGYNALISLAIVGLLLLAPGYRASRNLG